MPAPAQHLAAIVVGLTDYGEADRIVRLLTPELGRVSALARRAHRSHRRFGGALDIGNAITAALRPGRGDLWNLDSAELLDGRSRTHSDVVRLTTLAYACELCAGLAREHHAEPRLFGLLDMAAVLLDSMTEPPGALFRMALEAKALSFAGLAPVLDRCVQCGEPLIADEPAAFAPWAGGAVHPHCQPGATSVPASWPAAVERARRTPLRDLIDTPPPPGPRWLLADAIEAHLNRALKARRVLTAVEAPLSKPHGQADSL